MGLWFCAQESLCKQEMGKAVGDAPGQVGAVTDVLLATLCCWVQDQKLQIQLRKTVWKEL